MTPSVAAPGVTHPSDATVSNHLVHCLNVKSINTVNTVHRLQLLHSALYQSLESQLIWNDIVTLRDEGNDSGDDTEGDN